MNKQRYALLMILGAYPSVVAILHLMPPQVMQQPHWVKGLVIVPIMVIWMFYVISPAIQRYFGVWVGIGKKH